MLLIVENQVADGGGEVRPLPLAFCRLGPGRLADRGVRAGRPDGVRRSTQVMSGNVGHRNRLARRQRSELRRIGPLAGCGVRPESRLVRVSHPHLAADPGPADSDSLTGPAVTWLLILEQIQHVLGTPEGPVGQQPVVLVRESPPATDGDQPRVALFREDGHAPIPITLEATARRAAS